MQWDSVIPDRERLLSKARMIEGLLKKEFSHINLLYVVALLAGVLIGFASHARSTPVSYHYVALPPEHKMMLSGEDQKEAARKIELVFVGDIMLSRSVAKQIRERQDASYPFRRIREHTANADLAFGNLEGPLSDRGTDQRHLYSFRADPATMEGLLYAGFDVLSVANNHMGDWGEAALLDTVLRLKYTDISPVGAGVDLAAAEAPVIREIHGTKIAYFAATDQIPERFIAEEGHAGVNFFELERMATAVKETKKDVDIVIVSLHWGGEYETTPRPSMKEMARALVDAGADLVVGHHPHVVQPVEKYHGGWILYSLGNFVFDQNFSEETMEGLMVRAVIERHAITGVEEVPFKISSTFQPYVPQTIIE